ncbi:RNA polymerase sigma factor [Arabiibacter massiliensis]|uniref:RNA polymerase sigma factor n=1 Tax=Arabiibacter massiliensis TaxID=1870985 RepID=UPI0009BA4797|nr:RNA polymerase sigma factor [Arabiibacter massiliensis]
MRLPFQRNKSRASGRDEPQPLRSDAFLARAMDAWGDTVYRVALAQTGSPSDADDVYQDVFLRLLEDATPFESDEHLKAWLLRVTVNRCHDLARSSWNRRTEGLGAEQARAAAPEPFRSDVWEVVGTLPEHLRAAVHLFYVEGYSTDEIARIVGCQPATVRTRLHRAREQLRTSMEADRAEPNDPRTPGKEPTDERAQTEPRRLPFDDGRDACASSPA